MSRKSGKVLEIYVPRSHEWVVERVQKLAQEEMRSVSNTLLRIILNHLRERESKDGETT